MTEVNIQPKKSRFANISSIAFLLIVVAASTGLFFYNNYLLSDIETYKADISSIESNISEVESDKNLQIYSLLELNKEVIKSYELMNNVNTYISHMKIIEDKYNLEFTGFAIAKWEISTSVKVVSDNKWIAFQKTRDFIEKYRNDSKWLFNLSFINSVEWMDNMKFSAKFIIK